MNWLKTLVTSLVHLINKNKADIARLESDKVNKTEVARGDWTVNDPNDPRYIDGRTHYVIETENKCYFENMAVVSSWNGMQASYTASVTNEFTGFNWDALYTVIWDGVEYKDVPCVGGATSSGYGGPRYYDEEANKTIFWFYEDGEYLDIKCPEGPHTFSLYEQGTKGYEYVKIPEEFLPPIIGKPGVGSRAEVFNGNETDAAAGDYSHAEGLLSKAGAYISHAEGYYTEANGVYSHAEGYRAITKEDASHAEGYYTISAGQYQHAQGKYNIEDTENKYAHIVGNGAYNKRSNAHTLDWQGTGWFAGNVYVGGSGQDDQSADILTTKTYVDSPKDGMIIVDQVNGYLYIARMRDGNFVTYCAAKSIEITTPPTKTEYMAGDYFDPTGMVVTATTYDGNTIEITDFTYPTEYLTTEVKSVEIVYTDVAITCTTTIPITVSNFNASVRLKDFNWTSKNGIYTITGWKGTTNGVSSTEIIVPNNAFITL